MQSFDLAVVSPVFRLHTLELFSILNKKLYGCVGDCTLVVVMQSPFQRVPVAVSLNSNLNRVCECYYLWGI